jgi:hypothetical protein
MCGRTRTQAVLNGAPCCCRQAEAAQRRKLEEEELRKRRHLEHQRAEEALAVESDPRVKTWMGLVRPGAWFRWFFLRS